MQRVSEAHPKVGDVFEGKYVLREHLGQGGMGSVFLAEQQALARTVVIKILRSELLPGREHARLIRAEAMCACHVRNPHCITVIDCSVTADGTPYLVMEYVPGRSLRRVIAEDPIPLTRAIDLLGQILSALGATHESGLVHADVKTDNFLVELVDGNDHVTMIDFGLACAAGSRVQIDPANHEVMVSGTPEYMAPEVIRGEPPIPASDLYGAGVILYELLTGTTPFIGGTAIEIMRQHVRDLVTPPSLREPGRDIPPALDRVVLRALDKRPEARFPDAAAFAHELRASIATPQTSPLTAARDQVSPARESSPCEGAAPPLRGRLAKGSAHGATAPGEHLDALRHTLREAIVQGDVDEIANGYLDLASALRSERRFSEAACELLEGIAVLTAGRGPREPDLELEQRVDRLVAALAAQYEQVGEPREARHVAASMDRCPTITATGS